MKFLIVLASIAVVTLAQRPTYAGLSSKGYPELASRFRDTADDQDNNANSVAVGNRLGVGDDPSSLNLPTDARGDVALVNRVSSWPRENRPFWLINAEHLEKQRHPNENVNQQQPNPDTVQQQQAPNTIQQGSQQIQPSLNREQPVVFDQLDRSQGQQLQSRFGEPIGTETRTIKPLSQRGSFAGQRTI